MSATASANSSSKRKEPRRSISFAITGFIGAPVGPAGRLPTSTTVPPRRTQPIAVVRAAGAPEHSITTSGAGPSASAAGPAERSTTRSAPRRPAKASGAAAMSSMVVAAAPLIRAASSVSSPIGPAPMIATDRPDTRARFTACRQTASGSASAAASSGTWSGTGTHCAGVASNRVEKPPCMWGVFEAEPMK